MTDTTLTDSLTVQNVVASTAINTELALQPLASDLDSADSRTDWPRLDHCVGRCAGAGYQERGW